MSALGLVALLSDFGLADGYVGVMKGIMLGIAPSARLVDISHEVPPQDVTAGAWLLATAWSAFPQGTIFLAVIDPGVGTGRRAVALAAGGRYFVGPDNGLFSFVLDASPADRAVTLDNAKYHATSQPSATFHGRDIFAPCAAHLAAGTPLEALGSQLAPHDLVRLPTPEPVWAGGVLAARVLHIDRFGNAITNIGAVLTERILADRDACLWVRSRAITQRAATFGDGPDGEPFMLRDSSGHLAIAVRNGSAAAALDIERGAEIAIANLRSLL